MKILLILLTSILILHTTPFVTAQTKNMCTTPLEYFGFKPGSDRNLFTYEELISYLKKLDSQSDRIQMRRTGTSPLGKPIYICFISAADNISNLDHLQQINRSLAIDPDLTDGELQKHVRDGRVFVLSTLSMHSGEVGPSQAAPEIACRLAVTENPDTLGWLENTVLMLIPCHNPDGMDMVVEHYKKYKGTPEEGASMPGVYHKYVGHDNNRDFVTLSQSDTRAIARIYNLDWYPQVMVEKHQMGSTGPRYYVPPPHDPIAENIDARIWNWIGIFGAGMQKDMTADGLTGIAQHYLFDDYWPGSTETCIWKNVIGFLTEAASVHYASPLFIEPTELTVRGKGLSEYKKSINMPLPWEGGWWRLSDIIDYEISSTMSILKTASLNHDKILEFRNEICRLEVEKGRTEAPFYYILPANQHDKSAFYGLITLLLEHGLKIFKLTDEIYIDGRLYQAGDVVVPLAQPFRAFVKEVLEKQKFPVRHYTPDGEMIKPYDITSWSLPLHRGVRVVEIREQIDIPSAGLVVLEGPLSDPVNPPDSNGVFIFSSAHNESYRAAFTAHGHGLEVRRMRGDVDVDGTRYPAGSFIVSVDNRSNRLIDSLTVAPGFSAGGIDADTEAVPFPKIALVETWFHDMDAGWTRFVFDTYGIPFTVLRPDELAEKKLSRSFDVLIFPDVRKSILMEGKWKSGDQYYISSYPKEYTKGMGKEGLERVISFLHEGGHIIAWGESAELFTETLTIKHSEKENEEFQLPVKNVGDALAEKGLYVPGSLLRVELPYKHPLCYGMQKESGIFFRGKPVFTTSIPHFDMDRRVIARFPEEDITMSGYAEKEELLGRKAAMVWIKKGEGQLTLFAFRPQFRASTQATYKLLFNALLLNR